MDEVIQYRGYDVVTVPEAAGWGAWILDWHVPQGRVSGCTSVEEARLRAQREIEQRQQRTRSRA
jgi:hypothetical protein